ncbi:MAG: hypothetical protein KAX24_08765 [Anaerolineae bacterium]|nr:hypothetical protein [Anaerolineae bacterium]
MVFSFLDIDIPGHRSHKAFPVCSYYTRQRPSHKRTPPSLFISTGAARQQWPTGSNLRLEGTSCRPSTCVDGVSATAQAVGAATRVSLFPHANGATSVEVAPFCRRAILAYGRGPNVL